MPCVHCMQVVASGAHTSTKTCSSRASMNCSAQVHRMTPLQSSLAKHHPVYTTCGGMNQRDRCDGLGWPERSCGMDAQSVSLAGSPENRLSENRSNKLLFPTPAVDRGKDARMRDGLCG